MDEMTRAELERGFFFQQRGQFDAAREAYEAVLARDPRNEYALNLLGVVALQSDDPETAVGWLEKALVVNSTDSETFHNLGLALKDLCRFSEAEEALRQSLRLDPCQAGVHNSLGNVLASQNRHQAAVTEFQRAIQIMPRRGGWMENLCLSLLELNQIDTAKLVIERALQFNTADARTHHINGKVLAAAGDYTGAISCYDRALAQDARRIDSRVGRSTALKQLARTDEAEATLREALQLAPNNAEVHNCMGVLFEQLGCFDEAAQHFLSAIESSPRFASAYYQFSKLSQSRLSETHLTQIRSLLYDPSTHDLLRGPLHFALACHYEKKSCYELALKHFIKGNHCRGKGQDYDPTRIESYIDMVERVFPLPPIEAPGPAADYTPVFVLGMPRSGTTLTEQILASHSRIAGAGEVSYLSNLSLDACRLSGASFPQCLQQLSPGQVVELRHRYLDRLRTHAPQAEFIVDKTPMNFHYIGMILRLLPEAKIIYCRRRGLDNCMSIFRLPFEESQGYSHHLEALGHYYLQHLRLMKFWQRCYPESIYTQNYEETVNDCGQQSRRLLEFVGAEFEPQVLAFYDNDRAVLTPSAEQVRRPIYTSSIGRWRRYGKDLGPLVELLQDEY